MVFISSTTVLSFHDYSVPELVESNAFRAEVVSTSSPVMTTSGTTEASLNCYWRFDPRPWIVFFQGKILIFEIENIFNIRVQFHPG